jgi:hypothetical protein
VKPFRRTIESAGALLLMAAASCISDTPQNFRLDATLDGADFKTTGVVASVDNSVLSIAGANQFQFLTLRVAIPANPGTVSLIPDSVAVSRGEILAGSTTWSTIWGGSGSVTFTKTVGDEIAGTFSFTARLTPTQTGAATKVVTNGSFSARFR